MDVGHSLGPLVTGMLIGAVSFIAGFSVAAALLVLGAIIFAIEMRSSSAKMA
jgi:hypothetical protein